MLIAQLRPANFSDLSDHNTTGKQKGLVGQSVADHYGEDALSHEPRDHQSQTSRRNTNLGDPEKTRPHDAIPESTWRKAAKEVAERMGVTQDPVVDVFFLSVGATIRHNNKDRTSLATGDGRSSRKIEDAHKHYSVIDRWKMVTAKEGSPNFDKWQQLQRETPITSVAQVGHDWIIVAGEGESVEQENRILQALQMRVKLVLQQFRTEGIPEVNERLIADFNSRLDLYRRDHVPEVNVLIRDINAFSMQRSKLSVRQFNDFIRYMDYLDALMMRQDRQSVAHQEKFEAKRKEIATPSPAPTGKTESYIQAVGETAIKKASHNDQE